MIFLDKKQFRGAMLLLCLVTAVWFSGCGKKSTPLPPQPTTTPETRQVAPTIELFADPAAIKPGESSTLTWTSLNCTEVVIKNIGKFPPVGSTVVTPRSSATYTAIAYGPGGVSRAEIRITVIEQTSTTTPTTIPPVTEQPLNDEEIFQRMIKDVLFDFDKYDLTISTKNTLRNNAAILNDKIPEARILIEGHCDERGTAEYNLALGDKRANSVRDFLIANGVAPSRIRTISYGEERPFDPRSNEEAWAKNRRAHFVLMK